MPDKGFSSRSNRTGQGREHGFNLSIGIKVFQARPVEDAAGHAEVSIHASAREATRCRIDISRSFGEFQSTPPHGRRHDADRTSAVSDLLSHRAHQLKVVSIWISQRRDPRSSHFIGLFDDRAAEGFDSLKLLFDL